MRPSPFSAQKTFERHNSRRKSNISFCSNLNMQQAGGGGGGGGGAGSGSGVAINVGCGSRRGSSFNLSQLQGVGGPPSMSGYGCPSSRGGAPFVTNKSNSLSLPDSPASIVGHTRARSNSLRVSLWERAPFFVCPKSKKKRFFF